MEAKNPSTKRYPPELKERAVRMVLDLQRQDPGDNTVISRVARQLGVGLESLRTWVKCRILHKTQYGEPGIMRNALVRVG
jgi:transposase-like protein